MQNSYRFLKLSLICLVLCLVVLIGQAPKSLFAQAPGQSSSLHAGAAEVEITPPVGYPHYRGMSTAVHDPLYAKALVFREGKEQAALVVCDLISITRDFAIEVRTLASEATEIPYENIFVAATHTHTGPRYHDDMDEYIERRRTGDLAEEEVEGYPAFLLEGVVGSLVEANEAAVEVTLESGAGRAGDVSFNRRFFMKDGRVGWNPGVGNPDIVRPAGPIDPEVGIVFFRRVSDDEPIAGLMGFANHTDTVGGTEFSADYPGYIASALSEALGDSFISVFGMGTSGNINHINVNGRDNQRGHEAVTRPTGERLAAVVEEEIPNLKKNERSSLAVRSEFVYAPLQEYTEGELAWAQEEEEGREPLYNEREFLQDFRARKILSLEEMRRTEAIPPTVGSGPWTLPLEVQVFRLGEHAAVVGLPGEVFVELGMAIKEASPFETTLVVELTNRGIAYVPTEEAFAQGEYETVNSRLAPGGGEMMIEAAIRMLDELKEDR